MVGVIVIGMMVTVGSGDGDCDDKVVVVVVTDNSVVSGGDDGSSDVARLTILMEVVDALVIDNNIICGGSYRLWLLAARGCRCGDIWWSSICDGGVIAEVVASYCG
ncbi:hypothetical protein HAX54_000088 [Datura stramonium]|uniref:Secreted protein n=1 Tax=Datura stramonium TaxID=4076 RepID=A0ABS8RHZ8_DATST|nr:hypothetical protein [Datura stramonium]